MRLQNKVAIITGAASGMGFEEAKLFAQEGAIVIATDVQYESLTALVEEVKKTNGTIIPLKLNIALEEDWVNVISKVVKDYEKIDILVNNAGIADKTPLLESNAETTSTEEWDKIMNINAKGAFFGIKNILPVMKENKGGSIINISSIAAMIGTGGPFAYTASKGAIRSITKHIAVHYGPYNIRANSVHPGGVDTPMTKNDFEGDALKNMLSMIPLGRLAKPLEIANLVLFLASDESSYLTGAELVIDGGATIF